MATENIEALRMAFGHASLQEICTHLCNYINHTGAVLDHHHIQHLSDIKGKAIAIDDQLTAKAVWYLETIGELQQNFINAFQCMCEGKFKESWDLLGNCENASSWILGRLGDYAFEFGIGHISAHTKRFQDLFPYRLGLSPAFTYKPLCSICHAVITPRNKCEHEVGEIYDGVMCAIRAVDVRFLHVALVDNPAQRFSTIFPDGDDDERLYPIQSIANKLGSPWQTWNYTREERRQYHPAFKNLRRNDRCACGSMLKYKRCCLRKEKVFPHLEVYLLSEF